MEITQRALEQFVAVADEEHIGRAAARLTMTQPPLTQAIQRLERTVGVALLERSRRGVRLTPAGRSFAADARHLLDAQRAAIRRARRIAAGGAGELRVGYTPGLAGRFIPRVLAAFGDADEVRVHLIQKTSAELVIATRSGSLDLALARSPLPDHDGVDVHPLPDEPLAVAVPVGSRLSDATSVGLDDLREERFALLPDGSSELGEHVLSLCRRHGFVPIDAARADGLPGLLGHVADGRCVALVPLSAATGPPAGVSVVTLHGDDPGFVVTSCVLNRSGGQDPLVFRALAALGCAHPSG